jgi:hypothetical protein
LEKIKKKENKKENKDLKKITYDDLDGFLKLISIGAIFALLFLAILIIGLIISFFASLS